MPKEKIAILTNFQEFNPGYSLTGIVKDQCLMFTRYEHEVVVYTSENFNASYPGPENIEVKNKIPFAHLVDYRSKRDLSSEHQETANKMEQMLRDELSDYDLILDHDLCFTGWNLPYAIGIQQASRHMDKPRWLHWVHSVPSSMSDWWNIADYGPKHKIVFPNSTDRTRVAEQYRGNPKDVRIIPHIKDLRTWLGFCDDTINFIDVYPGIMHADVVCVYPASSDRLTAKGVDKVAEIIANIKATKSFSVFCVIANQWATGRQPKENLDSFKKYASSLGLVIDEDFVFTSDFESPKFELGIPQRMLRELMACSNLFIFPTREESFGLVAPEAALSTSALIVLNKSLMSMTEIHKGVGLYVDFGSFTNEIVYADEHEYLRQVAYLILGQMQQDLSLMHRTMIRKYYNMDYLYQRIYLPIIGEAKTWDYKRIK